MNIEEADIFELTGEEQTEISAFCRWSIITKRKWTWEKKIGEACPKGAGSEARKKKWTWEKKIGEPCPKRAGSEARKKKKWTYEKKIGEPCPKRAGE